MQLSHLFPLEHIVPRLQAESRREIFLRLMEPLVKAQIITSPDNFADALEEREDQVTTEVGHAVAIPHARSMAVRRLAATIGVAPEPGLIFGPDPNQPCRLFFLIAIPEFAPTAHLPLLRALAKLARHEKRRERLMACTTAKQIHRQLSSIRG